MDSIETSSILIILLVTGGCSSGDAKDAHQDLEVDVVDVHDGEDVPSDTQGEDPQGDEPETSCGNGVLDPGESCDGLAVPCSDLGSHWALGDAPCRDDCSGRDVSSCSRTSPEGLFEMVKPALRDSSRWGSALCNDGTSFGLGVRLSTTGSREWVILLQGGGFCDDHSIGCDGREVELTTTVDIPDGTRFPADVGGMANPDPTVNPILSGANFAYAFYCSSDLWAGTSTERLATTGDPTNGWYFSGKHHVQATLEILAHSYGLDDADPGTRVLFSGFSAGAFGAALNADQAVSILPTISADGRLLVMLDAGWFVDGWDLPTARIGVAITSDRDVMRRYFDDFSLAPTEQCEARLTATGGHRGDCVFGDHWYPALVDPPPGGLGLPVLVQQSLMDDVFAAIHGIGSDPSTMAVYADAQRASMMDVDRLFTSTASYHVICLWDESWVVGDPENTFKDVLWRFWSGGPPERVAHEP